MKSRKSKPVLVLLAFLLCAAIELLLLPRASCRTEKDNIQNRSWLMKGHDPFRSGNSLVEGPILGKKAWTYRAEGAHVINMEASADSNGVYFGSWGLIRKFGPDKENWDKMDGKIYGLDPASGDPLWSPLKPALTPYAFRFDGRPFTAQDAAAGRGKHLNFYNGTVEGTAAIDSINGVLYFGRGDGSLYAVNEKTGSVIFKFSSFDPGKPGDPEAGGEIVGGPLLTDDRILFATFAAPTVPKAAQKIRYETNAIYCLNKSGDLLWRFPKSGSCANPFNAALTMSRDLKRVYAVTHCSNPNARCELYCLDLESGAVYWMLDLPGLGGHDLCTGSNGLIYVAGMKKMGLSIGAAAFAVEDLGNCGKILWITDLSGARGRKNVFAGGVALYRINAAEEDLLVSSSNLRSIFGAGPSGKLYLLSSRNGHIKASWDPEKAKSASTGGLTDISVDAGGRIYLGAHGAKSRNVPARMYCLQLENQSFTEKWSMEVEGELDWASPAIGPDGGLYFGSSSSMGAIAEISAYKRDQQVKGADPLFYGVHDSYPPGENSEN